ncbi:MAG: glycosyltransferase family 2 protein [Prevotella sp.]|nr:glycosyltransferase family 2 protein [Prevotella sp.]
MGETCTENRAEAAPLVTVLVAVYNSEAFLRQCLDSLCAQTMDAVQIVCVDDASTDGSLAILRDYAARDGRVEVIALSENHGLAYARNKALERARGRYICFLDSDDWMSADSLEQACRTFGADDTLDALLFDTVYVYPDREETYPMEPFSRMSGKAAFEASLTWKIHGVYIVRAEIHKRFPYDDSARAYSDDNTTRLHYYVSRQVGCCKGRYYYRQHEGSVTHKPSARRFDYLRANASMKRMLLELGAEDRIVTLYENVRWLNVVDSMYFIYRNRNVLSPEDIASGEELIRQTWQGIEMGRLTARNRWKFGYMPLRLSWRLFRMQERIYFWLKNSSLWLFLRRKLLHSR